MYKLYHTTSGISLLLHDTKAMPRQSVNNSDIPQVYCDITCLYLVMCNIPILLSIPRKLSHTIPTFNINIIMASFNIY